MGILALQGGVVEHASALRAVGAEVSEVRAAHQLAGLDGLVLPGGESTTMSLLADRDALLGALRAAVAGGLPAFGTCAGLIALAREIEGTDRPLVGGLDIVVRRNAYGRQAASFEADLGVPSLGEPPLAAVFIRAPQVISVGHEVDILARYRGVPVAVRQGPLWGTAFHPELTEDRRLHEAFVESVRTRVRSAVPLDAPAKGGRGVRA